MKYYKDINGNIYTGDKADYRDKELTAQELETYNADRAKQQAENEAKRKLNEIDRQSIRALRTCIVAILDGKTPDIADKTELTSKETEAKTERLKIK